MEKVAVKKEVPEPFRPAEHGRNFAEVPVIDIDDSSDSDSDDASSSSSAGDVTGKRGRVSSGGDDEIGAKKKRLSDGSSVVLPEGFSDPLPSKDVANGGGDAAAKQSVPYSNTKQFWKAGDFETGNSAEWESSSGGLDHVRVHPRFLHSNATSHKWVLGAFAELLDNSLDEVCNGATYVNIGMLKNRKDGNRMLVIEDNGGGMDPDKMRQCMSLGYSLKSKVAGTIGQYGNGFKTSTMRLGADVIVFSRSSGKDGKRPTQSIGLLSYTFLRCFGQEDIVVPMLDYERGNGEWKKIIRSSAGDWNRNVDTIVQWSPFSSEAELLRQLDQMKDQGTRIVIYNLWEDDQGELELDFDADQHDIQIRGVNRDEKNIQMALQFPNSRHFLTYRHSLRSYASILYLRIPPGFRIILRGKDVEHHNIVNDMMMTKEVTYRPQPSTDGIPKDTNMVATVTMGFVKDAKSHIDVQGFNVYHKNRLIKPFWRLWNAAGSDGRGVIGVLEANFVEPAHDKQGFERTIVLSRLETKLVQMQKNYWTTYCHKIGYAPRRRKGSNDRDSSPDDFLETPPSQSKKKTLATSSKISFSGSDKVSSHTSLNQENGHPRAASSNGHLCSNGMSLRSRPRANGKGAISPGQSSNTAENLSDDDLQTPVPEKHANGHSEKVTSSVKSLPKDNSRVVQSPRLVEAEHNSSTGRRATPAIAQSQSKGGGVTGKETGILSNDRLTMDQLMEENRELKERLKKKEAEILGDLMNDLRFEREQRESLKAQLLEAEKKIEELNKEQESLIDIFSEERERRDNEEDSLRKKLKEASNTIQELLDKVRLLEKRK